LRLLGSPSEVTGKPRDLWAKETLFDPRLGYGGADAVATLECGCKTMGYHEFVTGDLDLWEYQNDVTAGLANRPVGTRGTTHYQGRRSRGIRG